MTLKICSSLRLCDSMILEKFFKWFALMRVVPCWGKGEGTNLMSTYNKPGTFMCILPPPISL